MVGSRSGPRREQRSPGVAAAGAGAGWVPRGRAGAPGSPRPARSPARAGLCGPAPGTRPSPRPRPRSPGPRSAPGCRRRCCGTCGSRRSAGSTAGLSRATRKGPPFCHELGTTSTVAGRGLIVVHGPVRRQCSSSRGPPCSARSAAWRAASVSARPRRRSAEWGPRGRHHRRRTPAGIRRRSSSSSASRPARRSRANSTCSTPM